MIVIRVQGAIDLSHTFSLLVHSPRDPNMSQRSPQTEESHALPYVVAVCVSSGGIPKQPLPSCWVNVTGLHGDGHHHAKHVRADRAVSIFDLEILHELQSEGFDLRPGSAGENLTVAGLHVQDLQPGTLVRIGSVVLRLEAPRKPCYVLDAIDERLKDAIVGRCGYMASVIEEGWVSAGMMIAVSRGPRNGERSAAEAAASVNAQEVIISD